MGPGIIAAVLKQPHYNVKEQKMLSPVKIDVSRSSGKLRSIYQPLSTGRRSRKNPVLETGLVAVRFKALFGDYGLRRAIVHSFLHSTLEIAGYFRGDHFGDIIAHFEDIGNAVGTKPTSRAQIRINPYLHRKLLWKMVFYRGKSNTNSRFLQVQDCLQITFLCHIWP